MGGQMVRGGNGGGGETRLYSRVGEEIGAAFPDLVAAFNQDAVIAGDLLVRGSVQGGEAASFNALQQRLGRKTVTKKMRADYTAFVLVFDLLASHAHNLPSLHWTSRIPHCE